MYVQNAAVWSVLEIQNILVKCSKCNTEQSVDSFRPDKRKKNGLASWCISCYAQYDKARVRDKDKKSRQRKEHYRKSKELDPNYIKRLNLWSYYKLTLEQYMELWDRQHGVCAICGQPETQRHQNGDIRWLDVDHDHNCCRGNRSCGKCIRGLLCSRHNRGLGMFGDSLEELYKSIEYLEQYDKA